MQIIKIFPLIYLFRSRSHSSGISGLYACEDEEKRRKKDVINDKFYLHIIVLYLSTLSCFIPIYNRGKEVNF